LISNETIDQAMSSTPPLDEFRSVLWTTTAVVRLVNEHQLLSIELFEELLPVDRPYARRLLVVRKKDAQGAAVPVRALQHGRRALTLLDPLTNRHVIRRLHSAVHERPRCTRHARISRASRRSRRFPAPAARPNRQSRRPTPCVHACRLRATQRAVFSGCSATERASLGVESPRRPPA